MRSRLTTLLTVLGLSMALGAPHAGADVPCAIEGFSPRSVVVGLAPVDRTFALSTSGCSLGYWRAQSEAFYVHHGSPQQTFDPSSHAEAGVHAVEVDAYNDDYLRHSRVFPDAFALLRRTTWQARTFDASPEPARRGSALAVTGRLLVVDWVNHRYIPYAGRSVAVEFRSPTGSFTVVKAVTTDAKGWVRTSVPADVTGTWRLRFSGSPIAGPAVTPGDTVQVVG